MASDLSKSFLFLRSCFRGEFPVHLKKKKSLVVVIIKNKNKNRTDGVPSLAPRSPSEFGGPLRVCGRGRGSRRPPTVYVNPQLLAGSVAAEVTVAGNGVDSPECDFGHLLHAGDCHRYPFPAPSLG